jgi:hypothetical protein
MIERLLRQIDAPANYDECIPWKGSLTAEGGYGVLASTTAHRVAYSLFVGDLPADSRNFTVDHLCKNRICVNPFHLELVPHIVNIERGDKASATHCQRGHEFTEENTICEKRGTGRSRRRCRTCREKQQREWWERNPEKRRAYEVNRAPRDWRNGARGTLLYPK